MKIILLILKYTTVATASGIGILLVWQVASFFNIKFSYINTLNLPSYEKRGISSKKILDNFNSLGYNKAVQYKGRRPIIIFEVDKIPKNVVGYAQVRLNHCIIKIEKGLTAIDFKNVLIHEYLHCLGFNHVNDKSNLMCISLAVQVSKAQYEYWANKAAEKLSFRWTNTRFVSSKLNKGEK